MDANNPQDDGDDRFAGDLLVGADAIRAYLVGLGMPQSVDVYYLKRSGHWPIGNTAGTDGKIIASKRRLIRHLEKITRGPTAADRQRRARRRRRISQLLTWKRPAGLSLARGKARRPAKGDQAMITSASSNPRPNAAQAFKTVTGQFIAKATSGYSPWQRAQDAARWHRGELIIKPTVKLAAHTFRVSALLVAEAREQLERRKRGKHHSNGGTSTLSDSAVEHIVAEVGVERIWRAVDKLTQPPLPLVMK